MTASGESGTDERAGAARFVEVALNLPRLTPLTYRARGDLGARLLPGTRVMVPLGSRRMTGYVVSPPTDSPPPGAEEVRFRDVIEALEEEPLLTEELLSLTRWVAGYYCCGWGEAIRAALPGIAERRRRGKLRLTETGRREAARGGPSPGLPGMEAGGGEAPLCRRLLDSLRERPRRAAELGAAFGRGVPRELASLEAAGWIERFEEETGRRLSPHAKFVRLLHPPGREDRAALRRRAPRQAAVLETLEGAGGARMLLRELEARVPGARAACGPMRRKNWIAVEEGELEVAPPRPGAGEETAPPRHLDLTPAQSAAVRAVQEDMEAGRFQVILLHGITGSGKTEVYLRLAAEVARRGRTALILVPEIGLTPQLLGRFRACFGGRVAQVHSALPERQRAAEWRRIRAGEVDVVVGTRSAVFAPLPRLGFLAVDEEHDGSYKQEETPRYHARDTAIVRGREASLPVVLGSATPSMETYAQARGGRYRLIELPARPGDRPLPEVRVVDLRRLRGGDPMRPPLLSAELAEAIGERLERKEQTLLFLNRRGFSSVILCRDCGQVAGCPNCSSSLTYHIEQMRLRCHLCDFDAPSLERCPECGSDRVGYLGLGTERVEEAVRARFPEARVRRLDRDAVRRAGGLDRALGAMRRGEVDILIGTQMVAKGHDFPRLTLVGVVVADVGLHLPDFRAGERTFQLLTQVAGRAGRSDRPGEVIVQTFRPDHYAIRCAQGHDYSAFYEREAAAREVAGYPPFCRIARLRFESRRPEAAREAGCWMKAHLEENGARAARLGRAPGEGLEFLGPAEPLLRKVRGVHRVHMLLKSRSAARLGEAVRAAAAAFGEGGRFRNVTLHADVDPQNLL